MMPCCLLPRTLRRNVMRTWSDEPLVCLTDPDFAGRALRNVVDRSLPPGRTLHAFLSGSRAIQRGNGSGRKHRGAIGVEFADAEDIRDALLRLRPSQPGRAEFSRADLQALGLVGEAQPMAGAGAESTRLRRFLLGLLLGIGECDGKQLSGMLNRRGGGAAGYPWSRP